MFDMYADKTKLTVRQREPTTSGSVNAYEARFEFSPDWDGMERMAVFKAGTESRSVPLDETNTCFIPWEVLVKPDVPLRAGVRGTRGGETVLPTVWARLGTILEGVTTGESAQPHTPDLPSIQEYDAADGWHVRKWADGYVEMTRIFDFDVGRWFEWATTHHFAGENRIRVIPPVELVKKYSETLFCLSEDDGDDFAWWIIKSGPGTYQVTSVTENNGTVVPVSCSVTGRWK